MIKFDLYKCILDFLKKRKKIITLYFFLSLALPIIAVALPHLYGKIIKDLSENTSWNDTKQKLYIVGALWITSQIFNIFMNWIDSYFIPELQSHVRKYLVESILKTYKENYHEQEIGLLLSQIIKIPTTIRNLCYQIRNLIFPTIFVSICVVGYLFYINYQLGLIALVSTFLFFVNLFFLRTGCLKPSMEMNDANYKLHEDVSDLFGNIINIYSSATDEEEMEKIEETQEEYNKKTRKVIKCSSKYKTFFHITFIILFFSINGFAFNLFRKKLIPIDKLTSTLMITLFLVNQMDNLIDEIDAITYNLGTLNQQQLYLEKIQTEFGDTSEEGERSEEHLLETSPEEGITFQNLTIKKGNKSLIKDFSLNISQNKKIAIVGEIGSGKTSIINCLLRLIPYEGDIFIDQDNIKNINIDELRRKIIYVPQHPKLFNRSIYENVVYGLVEKPSKSFIKNLLETYTTTFTFDGSCDIDRMCGKNGENLSGGQKQILFLMRCLLKPSNILILDEPTSSLDEKSKENIMNIINDLMKDKTVIIVSHDDFILKYVDDVVKI